MKYVLCVLFGGIFFQGFPQNHFDILSFTYTNTTANNFEISDAQTTVEELALELNLPIVLSEKSILLTGLTANRSMVDLDADMPSTSLKVLGLNFGINTTINDSWSSTFMAFTRVASDKIKLTNDNLQIGFLSLYTHKKRADLKFRYGLYANTEIYGLIVVPIIGLYYVSPNKKFEADLNLPIIGDINYRINAKTWVGMRFDGLGTTYNLSNQSYGPNGAYVSKTSNELVSYLRFKLGKSIYLNTKVGYAISRNYRVFDSGDKIDLALSSIYFGDNRTQLNEGFNDGPIFKMELVYRLHFE